MHTRGKQKTKRPISRHFWSYLKYLPTSIRAAIIRSKFEIRYDLPSEITFKIADTEEEIEQALRLVHDAYVELNYIDPTESQMRFSKFHAHPNSMILVVKQDADVVGTMTIVPDSALGLPSDQTWSFEKYREEGKLLAEISSLTMRKDFRMRRGELLLPLCKFMYILCNDYLGIDGAIASTTKEVEPFYTDLLLFKKIGNASSRKHKLVKGTPATCGILHFNEETEALGKKIFNHRPDKQNLYKFIKETITPNMHFPKEHLSIQAYMTKKNVALSRIFDRNPSLVQEFNANERNVLRTYGLAGAFEKYFTPPSEGKNRRTTNFRPEVRRPAWCFINEQDNEIRCKIVDVSQNGLCIKVQDGTHLIARGTPLTIVFEHDEKLFQVKAEVRWNKANSTFGCYIMEDPIYWSRLVTKLSAEIRSNLTSSLEPELPSYKYQHARS